MFKCFVVVVCLFACLLVCVLACLRLFVCLFVCFFGAIGTPSDLLPTQLQPCHYEPGSEAEIIRALTNNGGCSNAVAQPKVGIPSPVIVLVRVRRVLFLHEHVMQSACFHWCGMSGPLVSMALC
jgi:hypothetical protein